MELKIQCGCGSKFAFDIEPENGRMPYEIACPNCNADSTSLANTQIQQKLTQSTLAPATPEASPKPGIRLNRQPAAAPVESSSVPSTQVPPSKGAGIRLSRSTPEKETAAAGP